jgi:leader peptidase (prepilin peptidase)/N-methyltransferase
MPIELLVCPILFVYGTIIGSFLNVVILRTPLKEQVVKGRSRCFSCQHTLAWYDLFPVLSWVCLLGKCRYCKAKISGRYALVESLTGLSFALSFIALGFSISFALGVVLFPVLICLAFLDFDTGDIEYWCPISIAGLGIIALVLSLAGVSATPWYEHLLGAVVISLPFAILAMFGAMGGGDCQLMAAAGLLLGWNIVPAAIIGVFLCTIVGVVYKIKYKPEKQKMVDEEDKEFAVTGTVIRFGPFLAMGIAAGFLYGGQIIEWYMGFMG